MVMDDPVQKIPTTLVTADSTGAPDAGGQGGPLNLTGINRENRSRKRQLLMAPSHIFGPTDTSGSKKEKAVIRALPKTAVL